MVQKRTYSLIHDEDKIGDFQPRIPPGREAIIGARISIGIHVAAMIFIILLPCFSVFQVGGTPACVTVSLLPPPGEDDGDEAAQIEKREVTDEIRRPTQLEVIGKPPSLRPGMPLITGKKKIVVSAKTKTNSDPPSRSFLNQVTYQYDNNTAEQETGKGLGGEMILGDGMNPAQTDGRPVPDGSGEFSLKQVDQPPTPARKIEPEFPLMARRLGIGGKVIVKFLVKADGTIAKASVVGAEPKEIFEQSALKAVREWQFNPGRFHGEAVATWVVLPIQFRLTQ